VIAGAPSLIVTPRRHNAGGFLVAQFAYPRQASSLASAYGIVCAWSGDAAMQRAAARWSARHGAR
jgi:hypothetical protein